MPCNPAIGGTGKATWSGKLDALGGEMGKAADLACIQYRVLNRGKGLRSTPSGPRRTGGNTRRL